MWSKPSIYLAGGSIAGSYQVSAREVDDEHGRAVEVELTPPSVLDPVLPLLGHPLQHRHRADHERQRQARPHERPAPDRKGHVHGPGALLRVLRPVRLPLQPDHEPPEPARVDGPHRLRRRRHRHLLHGRARPLERQAPALPPRRRDRRYVARYDVLPDPVLPAVQDREAHRLLLHRLPGLRRRGGARLGRVPENGRARRPGRLPVDVPGLGAPRGRAGRRPALVAARPPPAARTAATTQRAHALAPHQPGGLEGRGRRRPLSRPQTRVPSPALDLQGPVVRPDRLAAVAADHHVLWRRRRRHRNPALRQRDHRGHQPELHRDPGQLAVRTHMDRESSTPPRVPREAV